MLANMSAQDMHDNWGYWDTDSNPHRIWLTYTASPDD